MHQSILFKSNHEKLPAACGDRGAPQNGQTAMPGLGIATSPATLLDINMLRAGLARLAVCQAGSSTWSPKPSMAPKNSHQAYSRRLLCWQEETVPFRIQPA